MRSKCRFPMDATLKRNVNHVLYTFCLLLTLYSLHAPDIVGPRNPSAHEELHSISGQSNDVPLAARESAYVISTIQLPCLVNPRRIIGRVSANRLFTVHMRSDPGLGAFQTTYMISRQRLIAEPLISRQDTLFGNHSGTKVLVTLTRMTLSVCIPCGSNRCRKRNPFCSRSSLTHAHAARLSRLYDSLSMILNLRVPIKVSTID